MPTFVTDASGRFRVMSRGDPPHGPGDLPRPWRVSAGCSASRTMAGSSIPAEACRQLPWRRRR